jgi:hypothetical protein
VSLRIEFGGLRQADSLLNVSEHVGAGDHDDDLDSLAGFDEITLEQRQDMLKCLSTTMNRFNLNWKVMRAVMLMTGAVISGSAALAVLHAGDFVPQDLDIFVTSKNTATVLVFLLEQGYSIQIPPTARNTTFEDYMKSTALILTLKNESGEKIDLIAVTEPHVVHAIKQFHSTCVMNFISYYGIVCMYPRWTMCKKGLVKASTEKQAIDKYRGRGFQMVSASEELPGYEQNHTCGSHQCCPKSKRELHDDFTLFIPLEEKGLDIRTEENIVEWVLDKDYKCDGDVQ